MISRPYSNLIWSLKKNKKTKKKQNKKKKTKKVLAQQAMIEARIQQAIDALNENKSKAEQAMQAVRSVMDQLRKEIDQRENELIEEISHAQDEKEKNLKVQKETLEHFKEALTTGSDYTFCLVSQSSDAEMAMTLIPTRERLKTLRETASALEREDLTDPFIELKKTEAVEAKIQNIQREIRSLGTILTASTRSYGEIAEPVFQFGTSGSNEGEIRTPRAVATDCRGRIYVVEENNHRLQVFDHNGNFLRMLGGTSSSSDQGHFYSPHGILIAPKTGTIYVTEHGNGRIQIIDSKLNPVALFGSSGRGDGSFYNLKGAVLDSDGFLYTVDEHRVQIFDPQNQFVRYFGSSGSGDGELDSPYGIGLLSNGNIVVSEASNNRLSVFTPEGTFKEFIGKGQLSSPRHLYIDRRDQILVCDRGNNCIKVFTEQGELLASFGSSVLNSPSGITLDRQNRIIVSDENHRISVF